MLLFTFVLDAAARYAGLKLDLTSMLLEALDD